MKFLYKNEYIENEILSGSRKRIKGDFDEHGHNFFEIEYIISGNGTYIIDGKEYEIKENMLFFMSPANYHALKNCDIEIINVMFSCSLLNLQPLFSLFTNSLPVLSFNNEDGAFIQNLLVETVNSRDINYSLSFLQSLLYKLHSINPVKDKYKNTHIQSAIMYIMENFRYNVTLSDTAKAVGLTSSYLSDLFVRETGMNFKSFLDGVRFDYALKLLSFTDKPVNDIIGESGFCDYANFSRRFRQRFGVSASVYRKAL